MSVIANETSAVVPDWCVPCILRVRVLERLPFHLENHCRVFRGVALGRVGTVNCSSLHEMNSVKTGCITTVLRNRRSRNEVYPESLSFLTVSVQCTGKNKKKGRNPSNPRVIHQVCACTYCLRCCMGWNTS